MRAPASSDLGLPADLSTEGWRIDGLLHTAHWAIGALALVFLVWLSLVLVRSRSGRGAHYTHGTSAKERALPLALAALVLLLVDGTLFLRSHRDLRESILAVDRVLAEEEHIRVQIGARQWAWQFRYPGLDDRFGTEDDIYSPSTLVVPVGIAVVYELSSLDVVHSLYLPNFRVKQDAVPGRIGRGWFGARKTGRFEIACAQHCGVHHFQMSAQLEVLSAEDYARWTKDMSADAERLSAEERRARREEAAPARIANGWPETNPTRHWAWPWQER